MVVSQKRLLFLELCQGIVHFISALEIVAYEIVVDDAVDFYHFDKPLFMFNGWIQAELVVEQSLLSMN